LLKTEVNYPLFVLQEWCLVCNMGCSVQGDCRPNNQTFV